MFYQNGCYHRQNRIKKKNCLGKVKKHRKQWQIISWLFHSFHEARLRMSSDSVADKPQCSSRTKRPLRQRLCRKPTQDPESGKMQSITGLEETAIDEPPFLTQNNNRLYPNVVIASALGFGWYSGWGSANRAASIKSLLEKKTFEIHKLYQPKVFYAVFIEGIERVYEGVGLLMKF